MPHFGAKRSPEMVTIRNLNELKAAAHGNEPQTKLLILGLGEAIVTTCGQARLFLEQRDGPENEATNTQTDV